MNRNGLVGCCMYWVCLLNLCDVMGACIRGMFLVYYLVLKIVCFTNLGGNTVLVTGDVWSDLFRGIFL